MSLKIWLPLNGNIENQGTLNTASRLPSGYTEVEYLESDGNQFINTEVAASFPIELYASIAYTDSLPWERDFWGNFSSGSSMNCFVCGKHSSKFYQWSGSDVHSDENIVPNKKYITRFLYNGVSGRTMIIDGVKKESSLSNNGMVSSASGNIGLFSGACDRNYCGACIKCWTAMILIDGVIKRNFVPALRNSDNKPGMYDTVTGTFYINAGTGEFSVGPAVTCSITNNGATVDNNGKIGKCYSLAGGTITATTPGVTNKITVAAWIKAPDNRDVWRRVCGMQSASTSWQSASALFLLKGTNLYFSISNGSTCTSGGCSFNIGDSSNWFHACGTYDGTTARLYVNGVLKKECAIATTIENTPIWLGGTSAGERFTGKLNDFRLYDECLSADQIKEISRGMVLHYKMCSNVQTPNNCYAYPTFDTPVADGGWGHWTASGGSGSFAQNTDKNFIFRSGQTYSHKVVCDSSATWDYLCYQEPEFSGGYRSMCAIIKASDSARITENICYPTWNARNGGVENNKWTSVNKLRDGFYLCKCEGIKQDGSNDLVGIYVKPGKTIYISECYLENNYERCSDFWTRTDIEYDGSGFKNHGTVSDNVTLSADSPRYTGSYSLADGKYITAPGLTYINSGSISFWAKINAIASNGWLPFTGPTLSHYIMASSGRAGSFYHSAAGNGTKTIYEDGKIVTAPTLNRVWHHYVITNVDLTTWTKFMINNYDSHWNANMQMSDIRVYSTVLDATDVAELYKLGR